MSSEGYQSYVQITRSFRWGYWVEIVDPNRYRSDWNSRSNRLYGAKWFSFTFYGAKAKGLRKLAKYNTIVERERTAWKVTP